MPEVTSTGSIPSQSLVAQEFGKLDYFDSFCVEVKYSCNYGIDHYMREFISFDCTWIKYLFKIRGILANLAKLKHDANVNELPQNKQFISGEKAGLFKILGRNENEIIFYENDKHLNFRSTLMLSKEGEKQYLFSITIVHYNNIFGRIYFFFVKPFHKMIIKATLRSISQKSV